MTRSRDEASRAPEEPDVRLELYELGLLLGVLIGFVALAGASL